MVRVLALRRVTIVPVVDVLGALCCVQCGVLIDKTFGKIERLNQKDETCNVSLAWQLLSSLTENARALVGDHDVDELVATCRRALGAIQGQTFVEEPLACPRLCILGGGRVDTDALTSWEISGSGQSWEREGGKGAVPLDQFVPRSAQIPRLRECDAPILLVFEGPGSSSVHLEVSQCRARDGLVIADVLYVYDDGSGGTSSFSASV